MDRTAAIAIAALFAPLAAWCQTAPEVWPTFEVASVKPAADPKGLTLVKGGPGSDSPGQWSATNFSLALLINRAWHVWEFRVSGPPSLENARYDITAKVPPGTTPDDFNLMLRSLLVDRIGLVVHHEMREQPVYVMTIAKGGLKMKEAAPLAEGEKARAYSTTDSGGMRLVARKTRLFDLVRWWEGFTGRPILDKTGLTGDYDISVLYGNHPRPADSGAAASSGVADIATPTFWDALENQLGLKLEPVKAPADTLVVERFNKTPTAN